MAYISSIRVRFGDEDHAQVVYYPRYFNYFHTALEDFFDDGGLPYRKVLDELGVGFPVVHVEADFAAPLRFGDTLEVEVKVAAIGKTSVTFAFTGRKSGQEIVRAQTVTVCVARDGWSPCPIPDACRALFERHRR